MSAALVAEFALTLLENAPRWIAAGIDIGNQIGALRNMQAENRGPTQAEYDALLALNQQAHDEFQRVSAPANPAG